MDLVDLCLHWVLVVQFDLCLRVLQARIPTLQVQVVLR